MIPPVCPICHREASDTDHPELGDWIAFADYDRAEAEAVLGYGEGLGWFCEDHFPAASALSTLSLDDALVRLKAQFGDIPPPPPPETPPAPLPWWRRLFG